MKTSELIGPALDYAVAKCEGRDVQVYVRKYGASEYLHIKQINADFYEPSTDWSQGGPIIERELISAQSTWDGEKVGWEAKSPTRHEYYFALLTGPTPLVAAMRCFVASKLGDNVDIPAELKQN
jgi:hypothetical protein